MRSKFPGYYHPDKDEFDKLFGEALIVFDTNVLLDLYRVSPETSKELMDVIKKLNDRLWIPYQVGLEYHKELFSVIAGQIKKYKDAVNAINSIQISFAEKRNHPFLPDELHSKTLGLFEELTTFFNTQCSKLDSYIMEESVKDDLCNQLEGKIGDGFKQEDLEKIYVEGEVRYKCQKPPGFKDSKKPTIEEKYGDLIIWKEIIEKSKSAKKHILFVSNDTKKDWFVEFEGKTYGPHPSLIKEFQDLTGSSIYIYTLESFLRYADKLDIKVTDTVLEELKERKESQPSDSSLGDVSTCQYSFTDATSSEQNSSGLYDLTPEEMSNLVNRLLDRKGNVKITKIASTSDDVDSGITESDEKK